MRTPPETIDGAEVLFWAWSDHPFFVMPHSDGSRGTDIHGLAICRYPTGTIYRFSCNRNWETENDSPFDSAEEAMKAPSTQYVVTNVRWIER